MSSALRRYAYAQARVRARVSRLLTGAQLDALAACRDASTLQRELAALGWGEPSAAVLAAFEDVLDMLPSEPGAVVRAYRSRYECENLTLLLRARERGASYAEIAPLLVPVGALGAGRRAQEFLEAPSPTDAVARLEPVPFGDALRRQLRAARGRAPAIDRFRLELVAERDVHEAAWAAVQGLDARDRRSAARVLGVKLDCVNLVRATRLRVHHGLSPEEVLAYAIRAGLHLDAPERAVLAHEPVDSWPSHFSSTPYGVALAAAGAGPRLEVELGRVLARTAERALAGSPFELGLMLAYLVLIELQASDVQRLLEGKRLGCADDWLRAGLVTRRGR